MNDKLKSRKFWFALCGALCTLGAGVFGAIDWAQAVPVLLAFLGSYIGMEGLADALGRLKG